MRSGRRRPEFVFYRETHFCKLSPVFSILFEEYVYLQQKKSLVFPKWERALSNRFSLMLRRKTLPTSIIISIGSAFPTRINAGSYCETMESRLCKGLYFAGEVLDVDGRCGGYNLAFAFVSGYIAGWSV